MEKSCRIWSPVIYAELKEPRTWKGTFTYPLEDPYCRMEDMKIKPGKCKARLQGKHIEVEIACENLTLLESTSGQMRLITRRETMRERLPREAFTTWPDNPDQEFLISIQKLFWDGELKEKKVQVSLYIHYLVMVMCQEIVQVQLPSSDQEAAGPLDVEELFNQLRSEIIQAEADKMELKRKIHRYEKDLQSLRRGINRAESRTMILSEELSRNRKMIEELRTGQFYRNQQQEGRRLEKSKRGRDYRDWSEEHDEPVKLGGLIKRLFQNNA